MASAIVARSENPSAVPITTPATSPIAQPVRQWRVALRASRVRALPSVGISWWPAWWLCAEASTSTAPQQPADCVHHLAGQLLPVCAGLRAHHAVAGVVAEQREGHAIERRLDRGDMSEDVDAVALIVDHALEPADLAGDAPETMLDLVLIVDVAGMFGACQGVLLCARYSHRNHVHTYSEYHYCGGSGASAPWK